MTGKRNSKRAVAMSQTMKLIRNAHPEMPQTQVLSMASKQLSGKNKKRWNSSIATVGNWGTDRIIRLKAVWPWSQHGTTERYRNVFKTLQIIVYNY